MKAILPRNGGRIAVTSGTFLSTMERSPAVLVMVEIEGGPVITLTPEQWDELVNRIRRAPTLRELRA